MSGSKDASVQSDTDEELELLKNAYSSAMGRVIDQDGKPIKGAVVRWSSVEMGQVSEKTMTDEQGRFEAKELWPCEQIVFYGSKAGYGQGAYIREN
jgi:protocatechuate 3,4-dioxygenase beta subunit